ncbi:MAG: hypothetical protein Q4F83_09995 [Eubacteriales bacterium]|nr:hypothetical protein [Eubacteriales bacterium]
MNKEQNCHRTKNKQTSKTENLHVESEYDDGNIPEIDYNGFSPAEPLPESSRPRKDGPGGN